MKEAPVPSLSLTPFVRNEIVVLILTCTIRSITTHHSPLMDCDEVYNYWEPLHFMLYGTGLQTWEYSPEFRLRTFAYLTPLAKIGEFLKFAGVEDKILLFTVLRSLLAGFTGYCEYYFAQGVAKIWGKDVGWLTLLLSLCSPGMFHSSGALLPSATAMQLLLLSTGNLCQNPHNAALSIIIGLMATLALGWPFCAVCWMPIGAYAVFQALDSDHLNGFKNVVHVLLRTTIHAVLIQTIVCVIDYQWYQTLTFPSLNIFMYNAAAGGDELYGIEPASYYLKNLALNFNLTLAFAIFAPFAMLMNKSIGKKLSNACTSSNCPTGLRFSVLAPLILWFLLIGLRPHKEERFVFPVYPLIVLAGAIGLEHMIQTARLVWNLISQDREQSIHRGRIIFILRAAVLIACSAISIFRMLALSNYYGAPVQLYTVLNQDIVFNDIDRTTVCVGGDWHRFPSSFFLPEGSHLAFLPSEFKGQLPQPFAPGGVAVKPLQPINDMNREEVSRYVAGGISNCDYVVELMLTEDRILGRNAPATSLLMETDRKGRWNKIASFDFLDAENTHGFHRMLYIPRISVSQAALVDYALWKRDA